MHRDVGEAAGLSAPERDEEAAVRFLVDERVIRGRRAEEVAIDARGAVIGVEPNVVEGGRIHGPHDTALDIGDRVGKVLPGRGIAHTQRGIPHKLTQDTNGLETLLWEL